MAASKIGKWDDEFQLKNVAIHAHLLPTGKILYWGRRSDTKSRALDSLDEHKTMSYILDLDTPEKQSFPTWNSPRDTKGSEVNLFCSGHTFLPDGTLMVVGGHWQDGMGIDQVSIFNPFSTKGAGGEWIPMPPMGRGRWYPSAISLPNGNVLVISGAGGGNTDPNPQLWRANKWDPVAYNDRITLYPRLSLDPAGGVFMAGPQSVSQWLHPPYRSGSINTVGIWRSPIHRRHGGQREYAPSVMYRSGKVIYIGGGAGTNVAPEATCQIINLHPKPGDKRGDSGAHDNDEARDDPRHKSEGENDPRWQYTQNPMAYPRRQHNATILPDGTIFVNGGTSGSGFNNTAFKDPDKKNTGRWPIRIPELWNPDWTPGLDTPEWTQLAEEVSDRCYHSTTLLLPSGQIFSAGGGEYQPDDVDTIYRNQVNDPADTLTNAQIFSPPYLFNKYNDEPATRPTISDAPTDVDYNSTFEITIGTNDTVSKVTWIRIGSVTHCNNQTQNYLELPFKLRADGATLEVTSPANPNLAVPGHYMLFVLNKDNVPAIAPIIRLNPGVVPPPDEKILALHASANDFVPLDPAAVNAQMKADQKRPPVVLGLKALCPYGLGPCWGGAYEGLLNIPEIQEVRPLPDKENSLAFVYPTTNQIPNIGGWLEDFRKLTGGAYTFRGIQVTFTGVVTATGDQLTLAGNADRADVRLAPFRQSSKIEWDLKTAAAKRMTSAEAGAYAALATAVAQHPGASLHVTGTLHTMTNGSYTLDVKDFKPVTA